MKICWTYSAYVQQMVQKINIILIMPLIRPWIRIRILIANLDTTIKKSVWIRNRGTLHKPPKSRGGGLFWRINTFPYVHPVLSIFIL